MPNDFPSCCVLRIRGRALIVPSLRSPLPPLFELARATLLDGALAVALDDRVLVAHGLGCEAETEIDIIGFVPFCPVPGAMAKVQSRREGEAIDFTQDSCRGSGSRMACHDVSRSRSKPGRWLRHARKRARSMRPSLSRW